MADQPQPHGDSSKKKRKPNWSQEEMVLLASLLSEKRLVINGRFRPTLTHRDKREAWKEVANTINATNTLTHRTVEEVEMKWFSILSKSRKKIAAIKKEYNQSGAGGPQVPPLDPVDMKVEELLGKKNETVEGIFPLDINFHMIQNEQTLAPEQQQTQQQQEEPQPVLHQQQPQLQSQPLQPPHHQKTQLQPQQQQSQLQPRQYFQDGSVIEYTLIEPETSMGLPLPICSTPKTKSDDTIDLEYKAEKQKLK